MSSVEKFAAAAIPEKYAGGPIMKVIPRSGTRRLARSASHRSMSTVRIPTSAGSSTPLSRPEMWASGAGMSTASLGRRPWASAMVRALPASPRWVWSTTFGSPVEPEVNRAAATSAPRATPWRTGAWPSSSVHSELAPSTVSAPGRSPRVEPGPASTRRGSREPTMRATSAGPAWWCTGTATAPMRQHARNSSTASTRLGSCHTTASRRRTPAARSPPANVSTLASTVAASSPAEESARAMPSGRGAMAARPSRVGTSQAPPGRR